MQAKITILQEDLNEEYLDYFMAKGIIAIDCEMMGLNIKRDRLCMVQIGDRDKQVVLVQISQGQTQAKNLQKLLESNAILKIFHYARTDLSWLKAWLGINVANIFCTKIASKLARTYSDKHGLKDICKELTGKELNKNQQGSDWGNSQINKDQMQYAANDVLHLIMIYEQLTMMLKREQRMELALKCINFVDVLAELDILGYQGVLEH
jgi:ribonuclease D